MDYIDYREKLGIGFSDLDNQTFTETSKGADQ